MNRTAFKFLYGAGGWCIGTGVVQAFAENPFYGIQSVILGIVILVATTAMVD